MVLGGRLGSVRRLHLHGCRIFQVGWPLGRGGPALGGLPLRFDAKMSELELGRRKLFGDFD